MGRAVTGITHRPLLRPDAADGGVTGSGVPLMAAIVRAGTTLERAFPGS